MRNIAAEDTHARTSDRYFLGTFTRQLTHSQQQD